MLRVAVPQEFTPFDFKRNCVVDGLDIPAAHMLAGDLLAALLEDRIDLGITSLPRA
ncbi:MAG: hypothetical protein K2Q97_16500 [Burkholderiaceae bacterium]|nr:hypothetical protein [Burkholderiaceae bacterium]